MLTTSGGNGCAHHWTDSEQHQWGCFTVSMNSLSQDACKLLRFSQPIYHRDMCDMMVAKVRWEWHTQCPVELYSLITHMDS